tara:strand:+ start:1520 stop:2395 length:876 start_codon:yes stop_codon:yes gene_type:complete
MSASDIKPISINPELFKLKTNKNKTLKKNIRTVRNIEPNKLKSDLLNKIKNYRQEKKQEQLKLSNNKIDEDESKLKEKPKIHMETSLDTNDEFMESINFLKTLSNQKKKDENVEKINDIPISLDDNFSREKPSDLLDKKPQYSCLKNSSLPTFREWKKLTQKNNHEEHSIKPNLVNSDLNYSHNYSNSLNDNEKDSNKIRKRTVTYKYTLGKNGKKVSVLIKNNETRKKISNEHQKIKEVSVHDMKKYLKRHNLVKSGSFAPPHLIKKMYEQSLLSGDIKNKSPENILSDI